MRARLIVVAPYPAGSSSAFSQYRIDNHMVDQATAEMAGRTSKGLLSVDCEKCTLRRLGVHCEKCTVASWGPLRKVHFAIPLVSIRTKHAFPQRLPWLQPVDLYA